MTHWYKYRSKDKNIQGYHQAKSKLEVARFLECPVSRLVIARVKWNNGEFTECQ